MPSNAFKYFEDGFLALNMTGGTSSTAGKALLRLTDISVTLSRDIDETITFDNGFTKVKNPTYLDWTVSCSGVISSDSGESEFASSSSGDSKIAGTENGLTLLEHMKTKTTSAYIFLKISDSNYQKGKVILTNYEASAQAGSKMVYSLEMAGSGDLTLVTS